MTTLGQRPILQVDPAWKSDQLCCVLALGIEARNAADVRIANNLGTFLFIPAYAGFLISLGLILVRQEPTRGAMLQGIALISYSLLWARPAHCRMTSKVRGPCEQLLLARRGERQ